MEIWARLRSAALNEGFDRVGAAPVSPLDPEGARLREFLAGGRHGTMGWLERTADVRLDPAHEGMLPGARSVVVMAQRYGAGDDPVGPSPGRVARYARGRDYHNVLRRPLRRLVRLLVEAGYVARFSADAQPVYERAWAVRAGLGFIGKNACLIVPGLGSHLVLATLVTSAPLPVAEPVTERCGDCRSCLDACPTAAFLGPRQLDARRCVSYLTIEHPGAIDDALREGVGTWFLGCDACQDVCPFNRGVASSAPAPAPYQASERWASVEATDILRMDGEAYLAFSEGSPARRMGRERAARNAALNLGNGGDRRHLPVLREAIEDESEVVREAARWALARLGE